MSPLVVVLVFLILLGVFGGWGLHRGWVRGPDLYGGGIGLIFIVLLVLLLMGRL